MSYELHLPSPIYNKTVESIDEVNCNCDIVEMHWVELYMDLDLFQRVVALALTSGQAIWFGLVWFGLDVEHVLKSQSTQDISSRFPGRHGRLTPAV